MLHASRTEKIAITKSGDPVRYIRCFSITGRWQCDVVVLLSRCAHLVCKPINPARDSGVWIVFSPPSPEVDMREMQRALQSCQLYVSELGFEADIEWPVPPPEDDVIGLFESIVGGG